MSNSSIRLAITTVPFGAINEAPLMLLRQAGFRIRQNTSGRKLNAQEMADFIGESEAAIIGTESLDSVLTQCPNLRLLSKTGIGLDNIDYSRLSQANITLHYTPDAPTYAMSELALGFLINGLRQIQSAHGIMQQGKWKRLIGKSIRESTIGIIGFGRTGQKLTQFLSGLHPKRILVNDCLPIEAEVASYQAKGLTIERASKLKIFNQTDAISLHMPATSKNRGLINRNTLGLMRPDTILVNCARGALIQEHDLLWALKQRMINHAYLDVYMQEPYQGALNQADHATLTCHMGSCTHETRSQMETEAAEAVIDFFSGKTLKNPVTAEHFKV